MLPRYLPSRWVNDEVSSEAKKAFHPLGTGSRACIGMHLAYMELRLATAEFFRVFKGARLASSATPQCMRWSISSLGLLRGINVRSCWAELDTVDTGNWTNWLFSALRPALFILLYGMTRLPLADALVQSVRL